jgi:hypothetical protein
MASTSWGTIVDDTIARIAGADDGDPAGITPTVDPVLRWRYIERGRMGTEGGRDRHVTVRRWSPVGDVVVVGGREDQLGRDLELEVRYLDCAELEDRRHADEQDLVAALESQDTYPSGSDWALRVRRVVRESIAMSEPVEGVVTVTVPVRHIWRERRTRWASIS